MRAIVVPAAIACFVVAGIMAWYAMGYLRNLRKRRLRAKARWVVEPRTLPNGDRQVYLTKPGHDPFLFATVPVIEEQVNPQTWDRALYNAEAQAMEFDRIARENQQ